MSKVEKVFVKPGVGVKVPLPIPGGGGLVPAEGRLVVRSTAVERLIKAKDLIVASPPAKESAAGSMQPDPALQAPQPDAPAPKAKG